MCVYARSVATTLHSSKQKSSNQTPLCKTRTRSCAYQTEKQIKMIVN